MQQLGKLGYLGLSFPADFGGAGGNLEVAILTKELARVAGGLCSGVLTHCIGAKLIAQYGTKDQMDRFLRPALAGQAICAIAITEPDHGSDVAGIETQAVRSGEEWRIRGQKMFITNASHADVFVAVCRAGQGSGKDGLSLFLVERGAEGLVVDPPLRKLGWHTSDTAPVHFDDCPVPAENLLGEEGHGFSQLMEGFVFERVIMAAMGLGAAEGALDAAVRYARERAQFGRPISAFQAIRHRLADMMTDVEAIRHMTYWSAWSADRGPGAARQAAMAKLFSSETAPRVVSQAVQIFGGAGYMEDSLVARLYRDSRVLSIGGGTSDIMRSVVARASNV
jgi:acyl-CoA dehydrogenase/citronellyl-CoA dehydrogenase